MYDQIILQENVVISGVSGRFPESDNMEEFRQHLLNGEDMVTEDGRRWTPGNTSLFFISKSTYQ